MTAAAGAAGLARLALRRERAIGPCWIALFVTLALVLVAYIERNMATPQLKAAYTEMIARNSFFQGLGGSTVRPELGALSSWRSGGFLYVLNGMAAMLAVIRYTRADEDTGRVELLRAGPVGPVGPLTAALLVAGGLAVAGGVLPAVALIVVGLDPVGSLAYGAAIVAAGLVFAAIGAVAAQLARTARTARLIGLSVLGASYVVRYAGDASGQLWMKDISPVGWSHLVVPYQDNRWWVLAVPLVVAAGLTAIAYRIAGHRDLGAGLVPEAGGRGQRPACAARSACPGGSTGACWWPGRSPWPGSPRPPAA